jgi:hypothetical protein
VNPSNEHADSVIYGAAVEEIQAGIIDKGLMGKAIAKSKGNRKEAEALYLEWRVELLKEEAVQEFERREAQKKAKLKKEEETKGTPERGLFMEFWHSEFPLFMGVIIVIAIIIAIVENSL